MTRRVLVVAKAPVPGRAKTRLVPPLSAEQAAALSRALLLDTLDACRAQGFEPGILCAETGDELRRVVGPDVELEAQEGLGLADALRLGIRRHAPVALVSGDVPGLPPDSLARSFAALDDGADVVLGPATDGGYWLVAMREPHEAPFERIPWSTPAVLETTLARCADAGLRVELVDRWPDLDTAADLVSVGRYPAHAPRTFALLDELDLHEPAPQILTSEVLDESPWRSVLLDRLLERDGRRTQYTYLETARAVFVVPVTATGELVLVRQYRHPVRDWTLEVPAGSVGPAETPFEAARRELAEEVGGSAGELRHLSSFYSSSAHVSLRSDAFLATGVVLATASPEEGEAVSVVRLDWREAVERARRGGFAEGQTALAILLAAAALEAG